MFRDSMRILIFYMLCSIKEQLKLKHLPKPYGGLTLLLANLNDYTVTINNMMFHIGMQDGTDILHLESHKWHKQSDIIFTPMLFF